MCPVSTDVIAEFESSLRGTASAVEVVATEELPGVLREHVAQPAVGAPLPFEGASYDEVPVEPLASATDLLDLKTGVTAAGMGVANYGTITVRSTADGDELVSLYPERHVAVLAASDLVPDMDAAFDRLGEEFAEGLDAQVLATGPSATADMGSLVEGVHGPSDVRVVVLEDR